VRIEQLVFERYGIFADRKLSFDPEAALYVVLGANEAGKTTALSAIGDLLFASVRGRIMISGTTASCCGSAAASDTPMVACIDRSPTAQGQTKYVWFDDSDQPLPGRLLASFSTDYRATQFGRGVRSNREGLCARVARNCSSAGGRLAETLAAKFGWDDGALAG